MEDPRRQRIEAEIEDVRYLSERLVDLLKISLLVMTGFVSAAALVSNSLATEFRVSELILDPFLIFGIIIWSIALPIIAIGIVTANTTKVARIDYLERFSSSSEWSTIFRIGIRPLYVSKIYKLCVLLVVLIPLLLFLGFFNYGVSLSGDWPFQLTLGLYIVFLSIGSSIVLLVILYIPIVHDFGERISKFTFNQFFRIVTIPPMAVPERIEWMNDTHMGLLSELQKQSQDLRIDELATSLELSFGTTRDLCKELQERELVDLGKHYTVSLANHGEDLLERRYPLRKNPFDFVALFYMWRLATVFMISLVVVLSLVFTF